MEMGLQGKKNTSNYAIIRKITSPPTHSRQSAFTIVELLIVIIVIAILATVSLIAYSGLQHRARSSEAKVAVAQAKKKLELYRVDHNGYPETGNLTGAGVTDNDVSYQFTSNGTTYCLTGTVEDVAYNATNTTLPSEGVCSGHAAPNETTYAIGDKGPGDGIVFYDKGSVSNGWRYMEVAPKLETSDIVTWGCEGVYIEGADGTAIGTGKQNTADILAGCPAPGIAARMAANYSSGGKTDWFLPSKDELNQLYMQRNAIPGAYIGGGVYYASTDSSGNPGFAYTQSFNTGEQVVHWRNSNLSYRPVRTF